MEALAASTRFDRLQDADRAQAGALLPATKFAAPPARDEHVPRACLLERAHGALGGRHLLLDAPAGAGKSTLAAQWAAGLGRAAWVALDDGDDEPGRLYAALALGIRVVAPAFGAGVLNALRGGADLRAVGVRLVDELAALDAPLAVVLDDVHVLRDPGCHEALGWLLRYAPPGVRLALCTRHGAGFDVARLAAHGELTVLRGGDLAFDAGETRAFLRDRLALDVGDADLHALQERTEGWAAGLSVAALSLRGGAAPADLVGALDAGHRGVGDYLVAEALAGEDPERVAFLEQAAVLGRFSAALCDAALGREDSRAVLAELERGNRFVVALDGSGTWLRLHRLFGGLLRRRLAERAPGAAAELHARAGAWHRERGEVPAAIDHLIAAERFDEAGALIARHHALYINVSHLGATVGRWLEALPADVVHESVPLSLSSAWIAGLRGRRAAMMLHLDRALALPHDGPLPDGASSPEAVAELLQTLFPFKDLSAGLRHARRILQIGRQGSPWWPLALLLAGAWTLYRDGPTDEAMDALGRAADAAEGTPQVIVMCTAPALKALGHLQRGELDAAEACAREAARRRAALDVGDIPQLTHSWFATACVHRMQGRLAEAQRDAETAAALVAGMPPEADLAFWAVPALIELARVRTAQGDLPGARASLRSARERLEGAADAGRLHDWLVEAEGAARVAGGVPPATGEPLSDREQAVLRMLAGPLSLRDVGAELFVSHNTIKAHARAIYRKLGVSSRRDAIAVAVARELL